ncbi:MAG: cytochrome c biogenesis protein CcsA, partial [Enterobacterales bacterium]|nr:cytochrome c biogenesis protein CcsA [Enterobacterales bacterium]
VPLHKPILSIASWLVFGGFIIGRFRKGWRAKTAAAWTIIGFLLLFLAYFGTRTVLEIILG